MDRHSPSITPPSYQRPSATSNVRLRQATPYRQPLSKMAQGPTSALKAGPKRAGSQLSVMTASSGTSSNSSLNITRRRSNEGSDPGPGGLNTTRRLDDLEEPDTPILDGMQAPPVRRPITARHDGSQNSSGSAVQLDPSLTLSAVKASPKRNDQAARRLARAGDVVSTRNSWTALEEQHEDADASVVLDDLPGLLPVPIDMSLVEDSTPAVAVVTPLRRAELPATTPSPTDFSAKRTAKAAIVAESNLSLAELLYDPNFDSSTCLELVDGMEEWGLVSVSRPEGSGIVGEETLAVLSDQVMVGQGSVCEL